MPKIDSDPNYEVFVSNNETCKDFYVSSSGCDYCGNGNTKHFLTISHALFIADEPTKLQHIKYEIKRFWKRIIDIIMGRITC